MSPTGSDFAVVEEQEEEPVEPGVEPAAAELVPRAESPVARANVHLETQMGSAQQLLKQYDNSNDAAQKLMTQYDSNGDQVT